jgi:hypothetical protein
VHFGQVTNSIGDRCTTCGSTTYSWKPANISCDPCPKDGATLLATCSSNLLVPIDGYWHSAPRSPQVVKCPVPSACQGRKSANRTDLIMKYLQRLQLASDYPLTSIPPPMHPGIQPPISSTSMNASSTGFNYTGYYELLCSDGHRGNLCAQCDEGFGSTSSGKCIVCPNRSLNSLFFFLSYLVNVLMVGLTVSLQTAKLTGEQGARRISRQNSGTPTPMGQVGSAENRPAASVVKLCRAMACCHVIQTCMLADAFFVLTTRLQSLPAPEQQRHAWVRE